MSGGSWTNPRTFNPPRCRWCGRPIYAAPETHYGLGWIHEATNREACGEPFVDPATGNGIAQPPKEA